MLTSDERVIYRVRVEPRFEYPSNTLSANDGSDAGDHCDNYSHIIGIGEELIYTMWSGLRLSNVTEGVQTRAKMIVR